MQEAVAQRLEDFVKFFVTEFEAKLESYRLILRGDLKKVDTVENAICSAGEKTGKILGGIFGVDTLGEEAGNIAGQLLVSLLRDKNSSVIKKLSSLLQHSKADKVAFRQELVEAGIDIFQSYEIQFMHVTRDGMPDLAMQLLAIDAVHRVMNYLEKSDSLYKKSTLCNGVIWGESKRKELASLELGFKIQHHHGAMVMDWCTANFFNKAVIIYDGTIYKKKRTQRKRSVLIDCIAIPFKLLKGNDRSKTMYGYRRNMAHEDPNELEEKYYSVDDRHFIDCLDLDPDYSYVLCNDDLDQYTDRLITILSNDELITSYDRKRLKEILYDAQGDILKIVNILVTANVETRRMLGDIRIYLKNLNLDKLSVELLSGLKELTRQQKEIKLMIDASRSENRKNFALISEKQDNLHGESLKEHETTHKYLKAIKDKLYCLKPILRSIRFNYIESVDKFTGRIAQLGEIHNQLTQEAQQTMVSQAVCITGLGGVGKSELAREYAKIQRNLFKNVIWFDAETRDNIVASMKRLAKKVKIKVNLGEDDSLEDMIEAVYRYADGIGKTLIILDNAENYPDIKDFLRSYGRNLYFLVTSRNREWDAGDDGKIDVIELEPFVLEEAMKFMKEYLDEDEKSIEELATELQYFPLTLRQAAVYITKENEKRMKRGRDKCTINEYLNEYRVRAETLLKRGYYEVSDRYTKTVFATWLTTLDKIEKKESFGKLAIEIINILACISPDRIILDDLFSMTDETWESIELLHQYSMINLNYGKVRIHRLVQKVVRLTLEVKEEAENVLDKVLKQLSERLKEDNIGHIVTAFKHARKYYQVIEKYYPLANESIVKLGNVLRYQEALAFGRESEQICIDLFGFDHDAVSTTQDNIAAIILKQAKFSGLNSRHMYNGELVSEMLNDVASTINELQKLDEALAILTNIHRSNEREDTIISIFEVYQTKLRLAVASLANTQSRLGDISATQCKLKQTLKENKNLKQVSATINLLKHTKDERKFSDTLRKLNNQLIQILKSMDKHDDQLKQYKSILSKHISMDKDDRMISVLTGNLIKLYLTSDDINIIKFLVVAGVNLNQSYDENETALMWVVMNRKLEATKILLDNNADVFATSHFDSVLTQAVWGGDPDIVLLVLNNMKEKLGGDDQEYYNKVNSIDGTGMTPLLFACQLGNLEVCQTLLSHGADIFVKTPYETALHLACESGNIGTVKLIVEKLMESNQVYERINAKDIKGKTPLMRACEKNNIGIVKLLLDSQADVNADGRNLLKKVLQLADEELSILILEKIKADPNDYLKSEEEEPLMIACAQGKYNATKLMIDLGANILSRKQNALHLALKHKHERIVKLILETQMNTLEKDQLNKGLMIAVGNGASSCIVKLLIELGADELCENILHKTVIGGNEEVIKIIWVRIKICYGGNPHKMYEMMNSLDDEGYSPLMRACVTGDLKSVMVLHVAGADLFVKSDHYTVLERAVEGGNEELIRYIYDSMVEKVGLESPILQEQMNFKNNQELTPLMKACQQGRLNLVNILLEFGADIFESNSYGTVLHYTISVEQEEVALFILDKIKSLASVDFLRSLTNTRDKRGITPLMLACRLGNLEIIKKLIKLGADTCSHNNEGSVLHLAALTNEVVEQILTEMRNKSNNFREMINTKDSIGFTPLMVSCRGGLNHNVNALIDAGADVHCINNNKESALFHAVAGGNEDIVRTILKSIDLKSMKKMVNMQNVEGKTPLQQALLMRKYRKLEPNPNIVKVLIDVGADVAIKDKSNQSILHLALMYTDEDIVILILEKMQESTTSQEMYNMINTRGQKGLTPLMIACQTGAVQVIRRLLNLGADIFAKRNDEAVLHSAILKDNEKIVRLLLEKIKEIYGQDVQKLEAATNVPILNHGRTPLMKACIAEDLDIVKILLVYGADVLSKTKINATVFHYATSGGNKDIMTMIHQKIKEKSGLDPVDAKDNEGVTPLMLASKSGNLVAVKLILQLGADAFCKDNENETALYYALAGQNRQVIMLLCEKMQEKVGTEAFSMTNNDGYTPLMVACNGGNFKMVQLLLELGAKAGKGELECALKIGIKKVVKLISAANNRHTNVLDRKDDLALTPLMRALQNKNWNTIEQLLDTDEQAIHELLHQEAFLKDTETMRQVFNNLHRDELIRGCIDVPDPEGLTPLMIACKTGTLDTVKMLLEFGADVTVKNKKETAFHYATFGGNVDIINLMYTKMKDKLDQDIVNMKDNSHWTPLMVACSNREFKAVELLLALGANVLKTSYHDSVLHRAASCPNPEMMGLVLKKVKEEVNKNFLDLSKVIDRKDNEGDTPLMWTAELGLPDVAKLLIAEGADPKVKNLTGKTALHWAAEGGHLDVVQLLLLCHAVDPNSRDNYKRTPLYLARIALERNPEKSDLKNVIHVLMKVTNHFQSF